MFNLKIQNLGSGQDNKEIYSVFIMYSVNYISKYVCDGVVGVLVDMN